MEIAEEFDDLGEVFAILQAVHPLKVARAVTHVAGIAQGMELAALEGFELFPDQRSGGFQLRLGVEVGVSVVLPGGRGLARELPQLFLVVKEIPRN